MKSGDTHKHTKKELQEEIRNLREEIEEKTKLAEERLNQLRYLQADFDNYRKTMEKVRENIREMANESLIRELLTILDGFDVALRSIKNEKEREGLEMLHKNLLKILEGHGLKRIESLGKKFDPYYHEAVSREKSDKEDGSIVEEIQAGYILNSRVIRHSKVKIAENPEKDKT